MRSHPSKRGGHRAKPIALALTAALLMPAAAAQAESTGFGSPYVSLQVGASFLNDSDASNSGSLNVRDATYDTGPAIGVTAGYTLPDVPGANLRLRPELAVSYQRNEFDEVTNALALGPGLVTSSADGHMDSLNVLANLWLDYDVPGSRFAPYIGGGIGPSHVWVDDFASATSNIADDSDLVLTGQLGTGVAYEVVEDIELTTDYRYRASRDVDVTTVRGNPLSLEREGHTLSLGVRYHF